MRLKIKYFLIMSAFLFLVTVKTNGSECVRSFHIVSDFDDTIKAYQSRNVFRYAANSIFKKKMNAGFNVLYRQMSKASASIHDYELSNCYKKDVSLTVITAGPRFIRPRMKTFLRKYGFPAFYLETKPVFKQIANYKFNRITRIAKKIGVPFILIGDDTQHDHQAFHKFRSKNPEMVLDVYVHNLKNKSLYSGQIGYFTAFDIAYNEVIEGRLSVQSATMVGEKVLSAKSNLVVPKYGTCPTEFRLGRLSGYFGLNILMNKVRSRIIKICKRRKK